MRYGKSGNWPSIRKKLKQGQVILRKETGLLELVIDGQTVRAEEGATILGVARDAGIYIPTLCHHDALSPSGACRLCIVEIYPQGSKLPSMTTACNFPVKEEMEVRTNSQKVLEARRLRARVLLAKGPESRAIQEIAADLGVETTPFTLETDKTCIRCSLCVRVCREAIGADALKLITRSEGAEPHVEVSPNNCIGCGSCSLLCPTGFIKMEEAGGQRIIWDTAFEMKRCSHCGSYTTSEAHWKYIEEKTGTSSEFGTVRDMCPVCRRDAVSAELLDLLEHFTTSLFTSDFD